VLVHYFLFGLYFQPFFIKNTFNLPEYKPKYKKRVVMDYDPLFYVVFNKVHNYDITNINFDYSKVNETQEKIKIAVEIEKLNKSIIKEKDKEHIIQNLMYETRIDLKTLNALCIYYKINVLYVTDNIFIRMGIESNDHLILENNIIENKNSIDNLLYQAKNNNKKTDSFSAVYHIMYPKMIKIYNYILLQILLLTHTLKIGGSFTINGHTLIDNDLLILLSYIFNKIKVKILSNKIGELSLYIYAENFLGLTDELYNKIYDIITKTDKEIINIFDNNNIVYINTEIYENKIFDITKKIINILKKNEKLILTNIEKINISQKKRTLNDVIDYLL
jgi:hypothetical protein